LNDPNWIYLFPIFVKVPAQFGGGGEKGWPSGMRIRSVTNDDIVPHVVMGSTKHGLAHFAIAVEFGCLNRLFAHIVSKERPNSSAASAGKKA
jgi:hypothetical protein